MSEADQLTCEEAFRRLDDYVDRELGPHETHLVREHLEVCERCAERFRFEEVILAAVREKVGRIRAPAGLKGRIADRLAGVARPDQRD